MIQEHKMLIIDDNFINRKILHKLLTDLGASVKDAANAQDAMNIIKQDQFKLIFIDLYLTSLPAFELSDKITSILESTSETKIIMTTTDPDKVKNEQMNDHNISKVIKKPYQMNDLEELIVEYVIASNKASEEPVFNVKEFISIYQSKDMQKEIINAMLDERDSDTKRMEDAFQSKDLDIIYKALHYMKGSFSYLKATKVLKTTQKLLDAAKQNKQKEVFDLKETVFKEYESLLEDLKEYKDSL